MEKISEIFSESLEVDTHFSNRNQKARLIAKTCSSFEIVAIPKASSKFKQFLMQSAELNQGKDQTIITAWQRFCDCPVSHLGHSLAIEAIFPERSIIGFQNVQFIGVLLPREWKRNLILDANG